MESWLNENFGNLSELNLSREMIDKIDLYYHSKRFNSSSALDKVNRIIADKKPVISLHKDTGRRFFSRFYKYAVVLVVAVLLASAWYFLTTKEFQAPVFSEVSTSDNIMNDFRLPDSSLITLNINSKLIYPKTFQKEIREVSIEGKAFFNVIPNPAQPFVINAGKTRITVLGTSFSVNAYPGNPSVEVIVKSGKVQVKSSELKAGLENEVFLLPGEKSIYLKENNLLEKSLNINPNYLSWKTHDLIFEETSLRQVVECLNKVYQIDIQLQEPELNDLELTAHFDKKPVGFVLDVIRLTFNLELTGSEKNYYLSGPKMNK